MSSSIARITAVHGSQFGERPAPADAVAPSTTAPAELRLPDSVVPLLLQGELRPKNPAQEKELSYLLGARIELNKRTEAYLKVKLAEAQEDREIAWEDAKLAVRGALDAIESLKSKIAADEQEALKAQNRLRQAQGREWDAQESLRTTGRYASQKDVDAAKRRIETTTEKVRAAEREAADCVTQLNFLVLTTLKRGLDKLEELKAEEERLRGVATGTGYEFLGMRIPAGM